MHPCAADVIGGYWSSGMPYLKSSLKVKWDPTLANSASLKGVQLLLFRADISSLKVATVSPLQFTFTKAGGSVSCVVPTSILWSSALRNSFIKRATLEKGSKTKEWHAGLAGSRSEPG